MTRVGTVEHPKSTLVRQSVLVAGSVTSVGRLPPRRPTVRNSRPGREATKRRRQQQRIQPLIARSREFHGNRHPTLARRRRSLRKRSANYLSQPLPSRCLRRKRMPFRARTSLRADSSTPPSSFEPAPAKRRTLPQMTAEAGRTVLSTAGLAPPLTARLGRARPNPP